LGRYFFIRRKANTAFLPLSREVPYKSRHKERERMQHGEHDGDNLSNVSFKWVIWDKEEEGTNIYGRWFWFLQPDRYAYPSCSKTPHPIVTQGYDEHTDCVDSEDICKSFPLMLINLIWVCGIPAMTESEAIVHASVGPSRFECERVKTYNKE
jgi:hypothetical protein